MIILQNSQAASRISNLVFDEFAVTRGVRQENPHSPKLLTAVTEDFLKKAIIFKGINVGGEQLTNLGFADGNKWKSIQTV